MSEKLVFIEQDVQQWLW